MNVNIEYKYLLFGASLLLIPIFMMLSYKLKLIKNLIYSIFRMILQLSLVGIFLKYIFELDNWVVNLIWLTMIIIAGSFTIVSRSEVPKYKLLIPILIGSFIAFSISTVFISQLFFFNNNYFNAVFLIPISGMLIGNSLSTAIVGIRSLFRELDTKQELTEYLLIGGVSLRNSTKTSIRRALEDAFKPMLGNIATIGLIWLPGTMTGQIIAGSSPIEAVKFQFLIVIGYFSTCFMATFIAMLLARNKAFDEWGRLK